MNLLENNGVLSTFHEQPWWKKSHGSCDYYVFEIF